MTSTTDSLAAAVIYARFSTDRQDARSIDDQIRRCRAYAGSHGYRVVTEYKDAAISGSHVERADMQRLLTAARSKGVPPFKAVLVDDLARLSRDLGDTWQIVFRDLAAANVKVIDVTSGLASDGAGARLTFGAMALVNDTFLQLVRSETHRGLEGRALGGFWTGGRCYGFTTIVEQNPPDPLHPRKRPIIDSFTATIVLRIFLLFDQSAGLKKIAATLNEDGIAAPNDGGRGNKLGRGWSHTTIGAMLRNDRYIGRLKWNQSRWDRVPGRKSRRRTARPESEWVMLECPDLAIVPRDLWDRVQERLRRTSPTKRGRPAGTGRHVHFVAGLMRCGACGGSMTVVGRKKKGGISYARFGCTTHYSRGSAICANALSISEKKASRALVSALKEKLDRPELINHFAESFKRRFAALCRENTSVADEVGRRATECERRIANLTESLARVGWSEALAAKLRAEEEQLSRLKSDHLEAVREVVPRVVPHPTLIAAYLKNLLGLLETDPAQSREILSRFVAPIVMTPEGAGKDRRYRASAPLGLGFVIAAATKE